MLPFKRGQFLYSAIFNCWNSAVVQWCSGAVAHGVLVQPRSGAVVHDIVVHGAVAQWCMT